MLLFSEIDSFAVLTSPRTRGQSLAVPEAPQITRLLHVSGQGLSIGRENNHEIPRGHPEANAG